MLFYSVLALASIVVEKNVETPTVSPLPMVRIPTIPTVPMPAPEKGSESSPKPKNYPGMWANTGDYPSLALRELREGTTAFTVDVSVDGRVSKCSITTSSGHPDLDKTTCDNVMARAQFYPAQNKNGVATTGSYSNRVRWQIPSFVSSISFPRGPAMQGSAWANILPLDFPQKALAEQRQGRVTIELAVSAAGALEGCKVIESSTHEDLDKASCKKASERAKFKPALDFAGQPTAGRVQTELNWHIPRASGAPVIPLVLPSSFLPKAGKTTISFTVAADGSITDCSAESSIGPALIAPDAICKSKMKFGPYTDENGKPVARRVISKNTVEVHDVK